MNTKEFAKKYCGNCDVNCEKGIIETSEIVRCVDRWITESKNKGDNSDDVIRE